MLLITNYSDMSAHSERQPIESRIFPIHANIICRNFMKLSSVLIRAIYCVYLIRWKFCFVSIGGAGGVPAMVFFFALDRYDIQYVILPSDNFGIKSKFFSQCTANLVTERERVPAYSRGCYRPHVPVLIAHAMGSQSPNFNLPLSFSCLTKFASPVFEVP